MAAGHMPGCHLFLSLPYFFHFPYFLHFPYCFHFPHY